MLENKQKLDHWRSEYKTLKVNHNEVSYKLPILKSELEEYQVELSNARGEFETKLENQKEQLTTDFNTKYQYIKNRVYGETEGKGRAKMELASVQDMPDQYPTFLISPNYKVNNVKEFENETKGKKNRLDKEAQENIVYKPTTSNMWTNTEMKNRYYPKHRIRTTKIYDGFNDRVDEGECQATPRQCDLIYGSQREVAVTSEQVNVDYRNPNNNSRNMNYIAKYKYLKKSHSPNKNKYMQKNILNVMQNSFNSSQFDDSSSKFYSKGYSEELRDMVREKKNVIQTNQSINYLPPLIKVNQENKSSTFLNQYSTINKDYDKDNSTRSYNQEHLVTMENVGSSRNLHQSQDLGGFSVSRINSPNYHEKMSKNNLSKNNLK